MELLELMNGVKGYEIKGDSNIDVAGIAYDSRKVEAGFIFVCISGYKMDGHQFAQKSVELGAKVLIVEKDLDIENVTIVKVENSRAALSQISANFFNNPTAALNIVGVTGTNGKTTIAHMIKSVLDANQIETGIFGTIAYGYKDISIDSFNTTPESYELQKMFGDMKNKGVENGIMEVSSHALALDRVANIAFNVGVFTNLTPEHMDFHKNMEDYRNAKKKLFYKTSDANVINIDDAHGKIIYDEIKALDTPLISYGIENKADIFAKNIKMTLENVEFDVVTPAYEDHICINIPGLFTVYNTLATISACYARGLKWDSIKRGLEKMRGVAGRFELVENNHNYIVIVDYAHTPDALEKVLDAIDAFKEKRVITVFGCGGDRDHVKRPIMGEIAGKLSEYCIITSDNPRNEDPYRIMDEIEMGIQKTLCPYEKISDRKAAIKRAIEIYEPKDIILLAGKGHEDYQVIGDKKIDCDDKKLAFDCIEEVFSDET